MERSERLATSVTPDTKQMFRVRAAENGMNMSEYLRHLVHEDIGEGPEGNSAKATAATAD
ncbi:hypothetical protein [Natrinema pallidum]|uniref:Toxin-antitoxin system HicB family antitoxin n=1 Tax=Natrinema pallidum TaxID=69527 RepID=A0A4P9TFI8_9EURY|nr:hypothetical protein [Natrinema pallidum]QCW03588.1 hypothetical protein FGF80_10190 [Natrinema pallidum]